MRHRNCRRRLTAQCVLLLAQLAVLLSPLAQAVETVDITITGARVMVSPQQVLENADILIKDGRIHSVGKPNGVSKNNGVKVKTTIDGRGKTVIPGLIDTHIHLVIGPDSDSEYREWVATRTPDKLRQYLEQGVTTVVSVGDYWPQILQVREKLERGDLIGPRLLLTGPMITATDGHPVDVYPECATSAFCQAHWAAQVDTVEAAQQLVRDLAAAGVDAIKAAYDGGQEAGGEGQLPRYSRDVLQAIVDEAHRHQLPVAGFAVPVQQSIELVASGVDWISHPPGYAMSIATDGAIEPAETYPDFVARLKERGIFISTTSGMMDPVIDSWGIRRFGHTGKAFDQVADYGHGFKGSGEFFVRVARAHARFLLQQQVPLIFGTGTFRLDPRIGIPLEIEALRDAGMSPLQVLTAATRSAANAIGRGEDLGTLEQGKLADLVMVEGNPLKSLRALKNPLLVIKEGDILVNRCP